MSTTTWIDIADSAVKIGLGALIAGTVTLLAPIISFSKEVYADRRQRRLKLIEEAIVSFNAYYTEEMTYYASMTDYRRSKILNIENERKTQRFHKATERIDEKGMMFNKMVAHLELLGHHILAEKIKILAKTFRDESDDIWSAEDAEGLTKCFEDLKVNVKNKASIIHKEFGRIYVLEPELKRMLLAADETN
jgi:hypothetical protein